MSIEIRTYDGSAEELSEFIVGNWLKSYSGKMAVPDWSPAYFNWQMTDSEIPDREYLISAWKEGKLVGTLLAMPFPMWYLGKEVIGAQGSWLTVDPDVRRAGAAKLMALEIAKRQRDRNCLARVGYAFGTGKTSLGPRFWKTAKENTSFAKPVRLWVRLLDSQTFIDWTNNTFERTMMKVLPNAVCNVDPVSSDVAIRDYVPEDLQSCQELINRQAKKADLAILWPADRLQRQLQHSDFVNTMLVTRDEKIVGFLNYHKIGIHLRGLIPAAIVDILACQEMTKKETNSLLNAFCQRMKDEGVKMMLLREFVNQPKRLLLKSRFIPQPVDSTLLLSRSDPQADITPSKVKSIQVLWR